MNSVEDLESLKHFEGAGTSFETSFSTDGSQVTFEVKRGL
jgi:hypothetical protein